MKQSETRESFCAVQWSPSIFSSTPWSSPTGYPCRAEPYSSTARRWAVRRASYASEHTWSTRSGSSPIRPSSDAPEPSAPVAIAWSMFSTLTGPTPAAGVSRAASRSSTLSSLGATPAGLGVSSAASFAARSIRRRRSLNHYACASSTSFRSWSAICALSARPSAAAIVSSYNRSSSRSSDTPLMSKNTSAATSAVRLFPSRKA